MEYISKEDVLGKLYLDHKDVTYIDKNAAAERIKKIQSIDIVRCKNCRYCKMKKTTFKGEPYIYYKCKELDRVVEEDEYCSWGDEK